MINLEKNMQLIYFTQGNFWFCFFSSYFTAATAQK